MDADLVEDLICPTCGRPVLGSRDEDYSDVELCLPSNCSAWTVTHRWNHERGEWEDTE